MKRTNIIQSSVFDREKHAIIDKYLELIMLSREFRLSDLIGNYTCFEKIFDINSAKIQQFLEDSHIENTASLQVNSLLWNPSHELITFGTNHSLLDVCDIEKAVLDQQVKLKGFTTRNIIKYLGWIEFVHSYMDPKRIQIRDSDLKTT